MNPTQLEQIKRIQSQAQSIQQKVGVLGSAEKAGLRVSPNTSVERAQSYLNSGVTTSDSLRREIDTAGVPINQARTAKSEDFLKSITDSFKRSNDLASQIMTMQVQTPEEQELAKQELALKQSVDDMTQSVKERGIAGSGATLERIQSEIQAIAGGNTRESLIAMRKLGQVQQSLSLARGNRETQSNILKNAFDLNRQSASDALEFYKLTAPERIAFDQETGQVLFHNPITDEVYATPVEGFSPKNKFVEDLRNKYPDAGITAQDTEEEATMKLQSSPIYQKQVKDTGSGLITTIQGFDRERQLANDFEKYAEDARIARRNISLIQTAFDEIKTGLQEGKPRGAQSQAIITAFNKITDPPSVVRESEYARTPEGASLINRIDGYRDKILHGGAGLNLAELENIKDTALALYDGYENQLVDFATRTTNQAEQLRVISGGQFGDLNRILTPDVLELMKNAQTKEFEAPPGLEAVEVQKPENNGTNLLYLFFSGLKDAFK